MAQAAVPNAGDILRSEKQPAAPKGPDAPVLPVIKGDERAALNVAPGVKIKVSGFKISGNTAIDSATLQQALAADVGHELDGQGLASAAKRVRRIYANQGYFLAVVYLPQQEIKDGVVEIAVVEGRLGKVDIKVSPKARISEAQARAILEAHLKTGDLITETSIERPLLLIRDMPGLDARSTINPGRDIGTADLTVEVVPDKANALVSGQVDFDNYGVRFAGEHRLGTQVNLNSPLNRGDRLSLRAHVAEETQSHLASANYLLPVGPYGTRVGLSYANLHYKLGKNEVFEAADAHGKAIIAGVNVVHPVVRTREANLLVRLGREFKDVYDYLNLTPAGGLDRKKVQDTVLELNGDYFDRYQGYTTGSLGYVTGRVNLLNPVIRANDPASGDTQGSFEKIVWGISRFQQLPSNFYLLLAASGQQASKNLTSVERFSLGGPAGVRAYPQGDASGDDGQLYTIELRHDIPVAGLGIGPLTGSAFYDWGRVEVFDNPDIVAGLHPNNTLKRSGIGFGLSAGTRDNFLVKATVAWPRSGTPATDQSDPAKRDPRVYVQAIKAF